MKEATLTRESTSYIPAFDGLRALCISGVILVHLSASRRGWFGVDVFFVLSGFLITWILLAELQKTGSIHLPRFYLRRALRLQPAYFSTLLLVSLDRIVHRDSACLLMWLPFYLTYSMNFAIPWFRCAAPITATWSLCIEEQFYFAWPWCLRKLYPQRALPVLLGVIGAITLYRTALYAWINKGHFWDASSGSHLQLYYRTDTRIDTILIGCAFALALHSDRLLSLRAFLAKAKWFPTAAVISSPVIAWYVTDDLVHGHIWRYYTFGATLAALGVGTLVMALFLHQRSWPARLLSWAPVAYVGKVSYGIYLFHPFAIGLSIRAAHFIGLGQPNFLQRVALFPVALVASTLLAGLHYRYVESHFLKLRDRLQIVRKRVEPREPVVQMG